MQNPNPNRIQLPPISSLADNIPAIPLFNPDNVNGTPQTNFGLFRTPINNYNNNQIYQQNQFFNSSFAPSNNSSTNDSNLAHSTEGTFIQGLPQQQQQQQQYHSDVDNNNNVGNENALLSMRQQQIPQNFEMSYDNEQQTGIPSFSSINSNNIDGSSSSNTNTTANGVDDVTGQYKLIDDLQILKAIKAYYGNAFSGNVPWSFWQTYIKTTGCNRSSSSLYHHWNGSMQRKYGTYLKQKRLDDCIEWIQKEMKSLNPSKRKCMKDVDPQPTGQPLCHNWSAPVSYFSQSGNFNFPLGTIGPQKTQYPPFY